MASAEALPPWASDEHVPIEELARRQAIEPVGSLDDLARPELWDSHEEYERFLADLRERFAEFGLELHPEDAVDRVRAVRRRESSQARPAEA